jgi:hypothetical protein
MKERVLIQLPVEDMERIRLLAFQCRFHIAEIVRRCVQQALDAVELAVVSEAQSKGRLRPITRADVKHTAALRSMLEGAPKPEEKS